MSSYFKRTFLNKPGFHSVASIYAKVEEGSKWAELIISDCSRQVSLDVNLDTEDAENTLHKLDVLVRTLRDFRKACYDECGLYVPRL